MQLDLIFIDKTADAYLREGIEQYAKRLTHYCRFNQTILPSPSAWGKLRAEEIKARQGEMLLKHLQGHPQVFRMDEGGRELSSTRFAELIAHEDLYGSGRLALVVGGAYGFSPEAIAAYPKALSLSRMTFSHQMVRLILIEQVYRAFTIIKGEPYHHE